MMSFFLNPWVMAAGALLAVSPIIIHLINRMRFRRVKWAAMEFLLKAQKKMRRKKILEQLLLLVLRIGLVLLAGFLLARFLGEDPTQGKETRPVSHIVILDDSPSMLDNGGGAPGGVKNAFERAKAQITDKILPAASKASTPQAIRVLRMSDQKDILNTSTDPDSPPMEIRKQEDIDKVRSLLNAEKTTPVHVGLIPALKKAKDIAARAGADVAKVVHVVSDPRTADWYRDSEGITQAVHELTELGAKVHLIDVASPNRKPDRKTPNYSDNVGVVELKSRSRVAVYDREPVEFEMRVKNYGTANLKDVRAEVFVNGKINHFVAVKFDTIPGNQEVTKTFHVTFNADQGAQQGTRDNPLARFNVVTVQLQNTGADAIAADNVRHAVIEVRDKLSVLLVTRPPADDKPTDKDGDSLSLRLLFQENKFSGTEVVSGQVDALDKLDLKQFASVYLVNLPQLSESQTANLERYVRDGGGVCVFLGPDVNIEAYNNQLYRKGEGFMPFPLPADGPSRALSKEEKDKRGAVFSKRILLRDPAAKSHPALRGIYEVTAGADKDTAQKVELSFLVTTIDRHWPIARIGKWREDSGTQELYCLPNEETIEKFQAPVEKLIAAIKSKYVEAKFAKYRGIVDPILATLHEVAGDPNNPPLTKLAIYMDQLLADQGDTGPEDALLREFWGNTELADAKRTAQSLRDQMKYGDPLYVARRFGGGRVAVFTIPVCAPWSNWPLGPGLAGWVAVMTELQKYLTGGGAEENRVIGSTLQEDFEVGRYEPKAAWSFRTYDPLNVEKPGQGLPVIEDPVPPAQPRTVALDRKENTLKLNFADTKRPGAYFFTLTWLKRDGDPTGTPATKPEYLATVFNYDAELEGDLKRTNTEELKTVAKGAEDVHSPEDDSWLSVLEQKPTDLSSGRWIYLVILLVLIFEQAMAVRLSYHGKPEDLEAYAPSAAAAMAGRTAVPQAAEAEAEASGPTA
jgi:hypothetical protein